MIKKWASAFGFIILMFTAVVWAAAVPDTGQSKCYNNTEEIPCPSPGQPFYGQDANYSINPPSYTKLDGSGNALPDTAQSWVMVKDNVTALTWEMKTNLDGKADYNNPHDANNAYTWYDSNPATNGGNAGTPRNGMDTEAFIKALNDAHYGGYSDWRLPTIKELCYIVDYSIPSPNATINTEYFANTDAWHYWSSTTLAHHTSDAWLVSFYSGADGYGYQNYPSKSYNISDARAVRGGQSGLLGNLVIGSFDTLNSESLDDASVAASYTDNGDGTVTDTSTCLMWQQAGSSKNMNWEQALAYCEELNLGGYTDWRLPTIQELRSLVDYSQYDPAINTTCFPDTAATWYWSSTTLAHYTSHAWLVTFYDGNDAYLNKLDGSYAMNLGDSYARAVRGGQSGSLDDSVISVSPDSRAVAKEAGATTFSVSNAGTGTMPWTASVTSGGSWLSITSGASGTNSGTITCIFTENTSTSARTATIRVTATGATGSPADVTVTQVPTVCMATIDGYLSLHVPVLSYLIPYWGAPSYWADLLYEYNPAYPTLILFKLTNGGIISSPTFSCTASTLSDDLKIHIPDLLLPDGITHFRVDLEYSEAFSSDVNFYFVVTKYGVVSN